MQYTCANSITLLDIQLHAVYFVHICMYMPLCISYVPLVHFGSYSQTNVSIKKYMLHCNVNSCGDLRDTSKRYSGLFLKDRLWRPQLLMKRSIGRCVSLLVSEKLKGKAFEPWRSLCLHGFDIIWRFWSTWVCCTSNWPCHGPSCQMKRRSCCKLLLWMMKFPLWHWDTLSHLLFCKILPLRQKSCSQRSFQIPQSWMLLSWKSTTQWADRCTSFALPVITILYHTVKVDSSIGTKYNGPRRYNSTAPPTSTFGKAYAMALDDIQAASICEWLRRQLRLRSSAKTSKFIYSILQNLFTVTLKACCWCSTAFCHGTVWLSGLSASLIKGLL